jgi:hypothetical protein
MYTFLAQTHDVRCCADYTAVGILWERCGRHSVPSFRSPGTRDSREKLRHENWSSTGLAMRETSCIYVLIPEGSIIAST